MVPRPLRAAVLLALAATACSPATPTQDVVVARPAWTDADNAAPAPLGRRWHEPDAIAAAWVPSARTVLASDGTLRLEDTGRVTLRGPAGESIDTTRHHTLVLGGEIRGADRWVVRWWEPGQDPAGAAAFEERLPRALAVGRTLRLARLWSSLRRGRAPRLAGLELRFEASDPARLVRVALDHVLLLSDFDGAPVATTVRHAGLVAPGLALRPGRDARATLSVRPGDRLRLELSRAGLDGRARLRLRDGDGRTLARLDAGPDWTRHRVELMPLADAPGPGRGPGHGVPTRALASAGGARPLTLTASAEGDGVVLVAGIAQLRAEPERRPPLVVYLPDTVRADHLTSYGYARATDPVLARLARQGVRFETVYAASHWTRPSVATLMTGVAPARHGAVDRGLRVDPDLPTLAGTLADAGYLCVSMTTNHHAASASGLDAGFDLCFEPDAFGALERADTRTSGLLAGPVARLLEDARDTRLFLYVHSLDAHYPYTPSPPGIDVEGSLTASPATAPPDRERALGLARAYDAEVRHDDAAIGALDATLARLGLADEALLVVLSDHGEAFGEHGAWQHRVALHEPQVRVPWILRGPGLPARRIVTEPAAHVDVATTLVSLLGVPAPRAWQGRDLSALVRGRAASAPVRPLVVDGLQDGPDAVRRIAVVAWPHKLVAQRRGEGPLVPVALFDLARDPHELEDLRLQRARLARRLLETAQTYLAGARGGEPAPAPLDPALERWMRQMGYAR